MDTATLRTMAIERKQAAEADERVLVEKALDTLRKLGVQVQVDRARPTDRRVDYTGTLRRGGKRMPVQIEANARCGQALLAPCYSGFRD